MAVVVAEGGGRHCATRVARTAGTLRLMLHGDMARRDPLAAKIAAVEALRGEADSASGLAALREALSSRESLLVAAAASVARDGEIDTLRPALAEAFERWFGAAEGDPGCRAKLALAEALYRCRHTDPDPFLRGMRCVRREPVWQGTVDTAAPLRAVCALGLAQTSYHGALNELVRLLIDPERVARLGAAQALGNLGDRAAVPLLRFKVLIGDEDAEVVGEALGALLRLDAGASLAFAAGMLDHGDDAVAEAAALALGESRLDAAFEPLAAWSAAPTRARVGLLAIALLRSDRALEHLLDVLARDPARARAAVTALGTWRDDPTVRRRVAAHVETRATPALTEAFTRAFGTSGAA